MLADSAEAGATRRFATKNSLLGETMTRKGTTLALSMMTLLTAVALTPAASANGASCPDLHGGPQTVDGCTAYAFAVANWATSPELKAAVYAWLVQVNDSATANSEVVADWGHESALDPTFALASYASADAPSYAVALRAWAVSWENANVASVTSWETANEANFRGYAASRVAAMDPFVHGDLDRVRDDAFTVAFWPACFALTGSCGTPSDFPKPDVTNYPPYDLGTVPPLVGPGTGGTPGTSLPGPTPPTPPVPLPPVPNTPTLAPLPPVPPTYPPPPLPN